jgi:mannose-6-phosphate isomerase-like protein (cupin superfamily)
MEAIVVLGGEGETFERPARRYRILAELPDLEVIDAQFGPEFEGVDPHSHSDHTDCFYVLEGQVAFHIDGQTVHAGPGSFVAFPIGTVHGFRNTGPGDLHLVNIHIPNTGFIERLRRRSDHAATAD